MIVKTIPISWIIEDERRLDCGPFTSGSIEIRKRLEALRCTKMPLATVTRGGMAGMYHVGQDKLRWVEDPHYGIPLLRSADILKADLSNQPYILREQVENNPLFQCPPGSTLITRSGTIGRMAYCREDMAEMAISQDVLKVVPDADKIYPGYLYAFLSSKYGLPLIVGGTFGSIIVHIEAENISDLPVPRLGDAVEQRVHSLVEEAAQGRSRSAELRQQATQVLCDKFCLDNIEHAPTSTNFATFTVQASNARRFDAAYHSPICMKAAHKLATAYEIRERIDNIARVFSPGIFKRIHVDDPNYGYVYFSGSELFQYAPEPRGHLSRKAPNIEEYIVHMNWLLIQDAGQLGGLIGRIIRAGPNIDRSVVSNHLMRIVPQSLVDAGYLFSVLSSPHGYRAITRHAFGTSIPQLDSKHIGAIQIPWPSEPMRQQLAQPILESWELEDRAIEAEREAVRLVEQAIEEAA